MELCLRISDFRADVQVQADDRLVTLATCTDADDETRYVVVGVLRRIGQTE